MNELFGKRDKFTYYAWAFVLYLLGVILFGAWVRITHAGAGCGNHWPTCHGEIIPIAPSTETMIEYTHRLTSGMCGIFGLILIGWAWAKGKMSRVFVGAVVTMIFIIFEALVGAGIVLEELVADDDSVARAIVISLHLVNTLVLMGAASLTAWWAGGHELPSWRGRPWFKWLLALMGVALIATCMSGAVTALGDTLFPKEPTLGSGLLSTVRDDLSATNHFLVRLRVMHPVIAVITAAIGLWVSNFIRNRGDLDGRAKGWAALSMAAIIAEVCVGILNIALAAPGWVQICHLLVAQSVWISFVLMSAAALAYSAGPRSSLDSASA